MIFRKSAFNQLSVLTILLFLTVCVFLGCERKMLENSIGNGDIVLDFIDTPWEIVTVNDVPFKIFTIQEAEHGSPEIVFPITWNAWVFDAEGNIRGELAFTLTDESPGDPITSMTSLITYTVKGTYTARNTTLRIETQDVEISVDVSLEPKAIWEQQIEGITVEQLQSDLAAETKKGSEKINSDFPFPFFKAGTEYHWQTEQDKLTLYNLTITKLYDIPEPVPEQEILLQKIIVPHEPF